MIAITAVIALAAISAVNGAPFVKRIAQTTIDSVTPWEDACDTAGGGEQCNPIAVNAAATLLAAAGACDQQDSADSMIDLAKQLNNDATMISLAQIFAQQARNSPTSQSVLYCQQAPKNAELNGLFQCQFQGDDATTFVGGLAVGAAGTIPFGMSSPLSPAGSCAANPSGPIPDGQQLVDITKDPGVSGSSSNSSSSSGDSSSDAPTPTDSSSSDEPSSTESATTPTSSADDGSDDGGDCSADSGDDSGSGSDDDSGSDDGSSDPTASAEPTVSASAPAPSSSSSSDFQLQNGLDAQSLNAQFATLTADSSCDDTTEADACVGSSFAQCVSGKFVLTSCGSADAGLTCAALPLVNAAGTSITCTTMSDAVARIAATGATGGFTGSS